MCWENGRINISNREQRKAEERGAKYNINLWRTNANGKDKNKRRMK
jgi:Tfp pilus assembly protein PilX